MTPSGVVAGGPAPAVRVPRAAGTSSARRSASSPPAFVGDAAALQRDLDSCVVRIRQRAQVVLSVQFSDLRRADVRALPRVSVEHGNRSGVTALKVWISLQCGGVPCCQPEAVVNIWPRHGDEHQECQVHRLLTELRILQVQQFRFVRFLWLPSSSDYFPLPFSSFLCHTLGSDYEFFFFCGFLLCAPSLLIHHRFCRSAIGI